MNIIQKPCTNFNVGRIDSNGTKYVPEIIVLHIISGSQASCDSWFANPISKASSNYSIGLNGEIHQYVKDEDTAYTQGYHEGATFKLHKPGINPNRYCLSIEHEGADLSKAPEVQLNASMELIKSLANKWKIPLDRDHIIGHYEVDPIRKPNCPAIDKSILDTIVKKIQGTQPTIDKEKIKAEIIKLVSQL